MLAFLKCFTLLLQTEEEAAESASSSQTSTAKCPWDEPLVRAINKAKELPLLTRLHVNRVPGVGGGRKHVNHGLAVEMTKEEQRAARMEKKTQQSQEHSRETQELRSKIHDLEASINEKVEEKVGERVAHTVNEIMPTVMESMIQYLVNGGKGPLPLISLGASNSHTRAPPN